MLLVGKRNGAYSHSYKKRDTEILSIPLLFLKQPAYKPGSVPLAGRSSFIYAQCHQGAKAFYPPARASNPQTPVYMNLQPPRRTARTSLHGRWALTPPSHPYPCGRSFSSALLCLYRQLSVRKWSALRCPDFPLLPCGNSDKPADCIILLRSYKKKQNGIDLNALFF